MLAQSRPETLNLEHLRGRGLQPGEAQRTSNKNVFVSCRMIYAVCTWMYRIYSPHRYYLTEITQTFKFTTQYCPA